MFPILKGPLCMAHQGVFFNKSVCHHFSLKYDFFFSAMLEKQYVSQVTNFFCFQAEATAEPCPEKNESPMASAVVQVVFVKKIDKK